MKKFLIAAAVAAAGVGLATGASAGTLDNVKAKGQLVCGANPGTAGFGVPDQKGNWTGLDVDSQAMRRERGGPRGDGW